MKVHIEIHQIFDLKILPPPLRKKVLNSFGVKNMKNINLYSQNKDIFQEIR